MLKIMENSNNLNLDRFSRYYFVGAGGIGMSALERYFLSQGSDVAGYDRTCSDLSARLEEEGVAITYTDDVETIPESFRNPADTLVVITPAVPESNRILSWFRANGFVIVKRAALLGMITRSTKAICVAGSHGKTTTSSMVANIMNESSLGCCAFLGGILRNTGSNLVMREGSRWTVEEADEYDRSFHHLSPTVAIITSTDPDHLDIYGTEENYLEAFAHFTSLILPGGLLILHTGLKLKPRTAAGVKILTYGAFDEKADCRADNVRYTPGALVFDYVSPLATIRDISLGVPVEINIDNAVAAITAALYAGVTPQEARKGIEDFRGAKRRFEKILDLSAQGGPVLMDDYAHSPNEVKASISSIRKLWPGKKVAVIFQPHLYSRTRDFAPEFAEALSEADALYLLEIYPARELPIPGVTSEIIFREVKCKEKTLLERKDLLESLKNANFDILMTLGAADIDRMLPSLSELLRLRAGNINA